MTYYILQSIHRYEIEYNFLLNYVFYIGLKLECHVDHIVVANILNNFYNCYDNMCHVIKLLFRHLHKYYLSTFVSD